MKIIPISLPTPFYIGPVNVYLIPEDPVTLIDTGPKTKEANDALHEGFRKARIRVSDIRRIVLTHAHEDHCGLARSVRDEAKDAEVLVHAWETGHRVSRLEYEDHRSLLVRAGVTPEEIETMRKMYEGVRQYADSFEAEEYSELRDEEELDFETGALRIVHTPGHTPGSCSFVREADRTVIAGDCVLKRITPNPVLSPDPGYVALLQLWCMAVMAGQSATSKNCSIVIFELFGIVNPRLSVSCQKQAQLPGRSRVRCFPAPTTFTGFSPFPRR